MTVIPSAAASAASVTIYSPSSDAPFSHSASTSAYSVPVSSPVEHCVQVEQTSSWEPRVASPSFWL
eukprot:Gb_25849 [translate_table: standard]